MIPHIAFHTRVPDRLGARLRGAADDGGPAVRALPAGPALVGPAPRRRRPPHLGHHPAAAGGDLRAAAVRASTPTSAAPARCSRRSLGWHRFLLDERDPHGFGEPVLIHPWETGRDNPIEWDPPLWRVTPEVTVVHRRDTDFGRRRRAALRRALPPLPDAGAARHARPAGTQRPARPRAAPSACSTRASRRSSRAPPPTSAWLAEQLGEGRIAEESARGRASASAAALRAAPSSDGLIRPVDTVDGSTLPVDRAPARRSRC